MTTSHNPTGGSETQYDERVLERIANHTAVIGVVGLGYVGLPLAIEFARAGFRVIGFDVSRRVVESLTAGRSHIQDVASHDVETFVRAGAFTATTDPTRIGEMDAVSIAVPTPLVKTRDPDMSYVDKATDTIVTHCRPGTLVVLESTTYPGTTRELVQPKFERRGLTVGRDVFLAFSPERVDPGNERYNTRNTPKVVGGITPACQRVAAALYGTCIETVVPVSSPEAAELVKLLENTFRSVNIGLVNEMAIICDRLGVNVWEVIDAAATKPFGFMRFTPGPGIGGHCIPLDPHYLAWKMRTLNYRTRFIDVASEINSQMPDFVVEKVSHALNDVCKSVKGSRIVVIGVAYKKNIDDIRESPALDVIRLLEERGADVVYHDPFIPAFTEDGRTRHGIPLNAEELGRSDAVVIVTDHNSINYQFVADHASVVVDTRNATAHVTRPRARIVSLSAGAL